MESVKHSLWQAVLAGALLVVWIGFLLWMAISG